MFVQIGRLQDMIGLGQGEVSAQSLAHFVEIPRSDGARSGAAVLEQRALSHEQVPVLYRPAAGFIPPFVGRDTREQDLHSDSLRRVRREQEATSPRSSTRSAATT